MAKPTKKNRLLTRQRGKLRPNMARRARANVMERFRSGQLDDEATLESIRKVPQTRRRVLKTPDGSENLIRGRVILAAGLICRVQSGEKRFECELRGKLRKFTTDERQKVVVGDEVLLSNLTDGRGVIEQVLDRKSELVRFVRDRRHVIAANVDQAIIVASCCEPTLKPHLIDRYLVAAHLGNLKPVVLINKMDLDHNDEGEELIWRYAQLGCATLGCSVILDRGIGDLAKLITGNISVFVGQSGVGKSTLLNTLEPSLGLKVGAVIPDSGKGRHITTTSRLLPVVGGYVVDTPGIREFGLHEDQLPAVEVAFVEFHPYIADCRYTDCNHIDEEGCAVRAAVDAGHIHPLRYASYRRIITDPHT